MPRMEDVYPIPERFREVCLILLGQYTNMKTVRSEHKAELLRKLTDLFEYIQGETDENPVGKWFR